MLSRSLVSKLFLLFLLLALPSCQSSHPEGNDLHEMSEWSKPWLAYLRRDPYPALKVQIDSVEGSQPTTAEIQSLKDFLTAHVDKPAGITIDLRPPIPLGTARTYFPKSLAQYTSLHPEPSFNSTSAYMHLLFFNGSQMKNASDWNQNPHVNFVPYSAAAYINISGLAGPARSALPRVIQHELGHMLGLVSRRANDNGGHCENPHCLMRPDIAIHVSRVLLGIKPAYDEYPLCPECEADLVADRDSSDPCNTRFLGPIAIRQEEGYFVASLPAAIAVMPGKPGDDFAPRFIAVVEEQLTHRKLAADDFFRVYIRPKSLDRPSALAAFTRASKDPYEPVRASAIGALHALQAPPATSQPGTEPMLP